MNAEMARPAPGTWCADCLRQGHQCQAQAVIGMRPLCLYCEDGVPCAGKRAAKTITPVRLVPRRRPTAKKVRTAVSNEVKNKQGRASWFDSLSTEKQEQLQREINGHAVALAVKYDVHVSTIYNLKKKFGVAAPAKTRVPSKPRLAATEVQATVVVEQLPERREELIHVDLTLSEAETFFALLPQRAWPAALKAALGAL